MTANAVGAFVVLRRPIGTNAPGPSSADIRTSIAAKLACPYLRPMPIRKIALVVHDGVQALDVAGPADVFAEANAFSPPEDAYEVMVVAPTLAPVRTSNGSRILPDRAYADPIDDLDIVLVSGGPSLPLAGADAATSRWLQSVAVGPGVVGSVCTGAFSLGHAGLLDGRRVTTHWQDARRLAALFPAAQVLEDLIFIWDEKLVTSAGVTAGIDLALAIVSRNDGPEIARLVAKRLVVVAQRQGGQSQFSPFLTAAAEPSSPVARAQDYLMGHLSARPTVKALAAAIGASPRHLSRLFLAETGVTPQEFIDRARIDAARNRLEASDQALKAVAFDCGFGTPDRMRLVFERRLGVSPAQYRRSFRGGG
ncbi:MAG: DJ-1/PfpI family protein [Caulobacter sp.]|nr:DJ-1/PfpI family protein [Caulobacter sp.]